MYTRSAIYYDSVYSYKNYRKEVVKLHRLIKRYKRSRGNTLLDVGCGTGGHIMYLQEHYQVEGLDLNPAMLKIARKKHPGVRFHRGDMASFNLGHRFDIIVSLFSAIGHVKTKPRLRRVFRNMARHLQPGGVLIIEPWFNPDAFHPGSLHSLFVDKPGLKIARMNISKVKGSLSIMDMHYMVGTRRGIEFFTERFEMGLYSDVDYQGALKDCGLKVKHDSEGLTGRGLYIGAKAL